MTLPVPLHGEHVGGASSALKTGARVASAAMRLFVAGASGVIGRPLVGRLLAAGHDVVGMTRSEASAQELREAGAEAVVCDVYDRDALNAAVAGARPDAIVNQLTDIPKALNPRKYKDQMAGLCRIRTEGYRNVAGAAKAAGVERHVAQSISFLYAPAPGLAREDDRVWTDAPEPVGMTFRATVEGEQTVLASPRGLVLRYGWFYGPGTTYAADGSITGEVRKRRYPVVGDGGGVHSFIHVDDAADATVAAVASDATGILNVVDDDPVALRDLLPALAENVGATPPRRAPGFVARLAVGRFAVAFSTQQRGVSNARAKEQLGWAPSHPSWRETIGR